MQLEVYALSEHLCTVRCEQDWTGRQLKEAIEEATNYKELAGSQQLAVGTSFLFDSDVLRDLEGSHVTLTRRPCPKVRQLPQGDLQPIAASLRQFHKSPVLVWVITKGYVFNGNPDAWNDTEEVLKKVRLDLEGEMDSDHGADLDELPHRPLDFEMMDDFVPWNALAGISPHDIAAVLALQACYMWIGDGRSTVAALLLMKDNTLVAFFANISEASSSCEFGDATLTSVERGKTWEELKSKFPPEFLDALVKPISDWPIGHHRITFEETRKVPPPFKPFSSLRLAVLQLQLPEDDYSAWTCGSALNKWKMDTRRCSSLEALWFCPTRPLCFRIWHHDLMIALASCTAMTGEWKQAARDAQTEMTQYDATFPEAVEFFRSRFADRLERNLFDTAIRTEPDLRILTEVERRFNQKIHELQLEIDDFVQSGQDLDQPIDMWLTTMVGEGGEVEGVWQEPPMCLFVELVLDGQLVVYADSWLKTFCAEELPSKRSEHSA
eukprot:Skav204680  [mRNA]  locus=scaffold1284:85078:86562:- [translate_table: standard]